MYITRNHVLLYYTSYIIYLIYSGNDTFYCAKGNKCAINDNPVIGDKRSINFTELCTDTLYTSHKYANGCSGPSVYKEFFTFSCNQHDICYSIPNNIRIVCDQQFYKNMILQCSYITCSICQLLCSCAALCNYLGVMWGGIPFYIYSQIYFTPL